MVKSLCVSHKYVRSIRMLAIASIVRVEAYRMRHTLASRSISFFFSFGRKWNDSKQIRGNKKHFSHAKILIEIGYSYSRDRIHHAHWPYKEVYVRQTAQYLWNEDINKIFYFLAIYSIVAVMPIHHIALSSHVYIVCVVPSVVRAIYEIDKTRYFTSFQPLEKRKKIENMFEAIKTCNLHLRNMQLVLG